MPSLVSETLYREGSVISKDGTKIGYRQIGQGPGLILVEGAMGIAYNYDQLARNLANDFTVSLPDRRGRGMSPRDFTPDHSVARDVEDIDALMQQTGAHFVFGLSSGALITLEATRVLGAITKASVYEPPFQLQGIPRDLIARVTREITDRQFAAALVTVGRIVRLGPPFLMYVPRPLLQLITTQVLKQEDKKGTGPYWPLRQLLPAMRYDFRMVSNLGDKIETFRSINVEVLLLGGNKAPQYLRDNMLALEKIIPRNQRIEFDGLDHSGCWNADKGGHPTIVAEALRTFFKE